MLLKSGFKGYCLCKWHRRKERWADNKSAQCRLTSISFWQANFVPEQNVLNYTGSSVLMGEKPSSHPHDYPLKLCTAIISLRLELQWGEKKMFHEPRTQLHWVLVAAEKAIRVEKILKQKVVLSGHKLCEPVSLLLSVSLSPQVSHWLPREAPQTSKVTLKDIPWSFSQGIRHYKDTFHIFGVWEDWLHTSK